MAIKIRWSLLRNPSTTIPMQFCKHFTKMFDLLPSLFLQVIHNKSEMMIKIQYLHREGNSNYCICPDVIVTALSSSIKQKINVDPLQIKHIYMNEQTVKVSEQVQ
jgi:hypothetical protein